MKLENKYLGSLSHDQYDAIPAVRGTFLKKIIKCPRNMLMKESDTFDMFFGRGFHEYFLRPNYFDQLYTVAKPCAERFQKGNKEGLRCGSPGKAYDGHTFWYCTQHRGNLKLFPDFVFQEEHLTEMKEMKESILSHPTAKELFSFGNAEVGIIWQDQETELWCKALVDWLPDGHPTEVNLKTAQSAQELDFHRQCKNMHYHMSSAMALEGLSIVTGEDYDLSTYVVVEKSWPYKIEIHDLRENSYSDSIASREAGQELFHECLRRYKTCLDEKKELLKQGLNSNEATKLAFPTFNNPESNLLGEFQR